MGCPPDTKPSAALSEYLAAERTVLAWIRAGLALMSFGFVVARFGLVLQQLQAIQHARPAKSYGLSWWFGTSLIAAGVAVNLYSGWRYAGLVHKLNRGKTTQPYPLVQAVAMAVFLAVVGLAMEISLISMHRTSGLQPS